MRVVGGIAAGVLAWMWALAAIAAPQMHIEYAEAVQLPAAAGKTQFDAYGRRFALTLEANDRLLNSIPVAQKSAIGSTRILRGKVDGVPGSWVRLTRVGNRLEGAIWDGSEVYVVTSHARIVDQLTTPLAASLDQTVVYRLSDTLDGLPPEFCGLSDNALAVNKSSGSALQQYKSMVSELRAQAADAATDQINISLIADKDFQDLWGANALDTMVARLNVVEGIFSEQVGVILTPSEFRLVPANADPFTKTNPVDLITQLSTFRQNTPAVRAAGLAHLMTGKDLDGNIIGIAYLDALCDASEGVSLGDSTQGSFLSALVMAHELGHNFGARHDGADGACVAAPSGFLMAPAINGSSQFSACSLTSMASAISLARGACIGNASYADVGLVLPASPYSAQTNGTFSLPITVRSYGTQTTNNVRLAVTFPGYFSMSSATAAGASCSLAGSTISCELGNFDVGEEQALDLRITGNSSGSFPVQAVLTADNDRLVRNNTGTVQVGLASGVDVGLTVVTSSNAVFVTDPIDYTVDVTSRGALGSQGGTVQVHLGGIPIESFDAGAHTCAIDPQLNWMLNCQLANIATGTSTRITVRGRPTQARLSNGGVTLNVPNDSSPNDNQVYTNVTVNAEREVRTTVSREELRAVIGTSYELTYTLTTAGRLPASNVRFSLQQSPVTVFESVAAGSVTCTAGAESTDCDFGTLNPGDVRTIVVRFHTTSSFPTFMNGSTRWDDVPFPSFSGAYTQVYSNVTVDVAAGLGSNFGVDEDEIGGGGFNIETKGVDPAQNVTATIELAPPLRLLTIGPYNGPAGWTCAVETEQRGRCTGSFPGGPLWSDRIAVMQYTYVSATAGDHATKLTVSATNDGDASNNVANSSLLVRPLIDIAIVAPNPDRNLLVGQTTVVDATITTGKNPVPGAQLIPWASNSAALALDSVTVSGHDCSGTLSGTACSLGTLPANASIPVRAVFRALVAEQTAGAVLDVRPDRDSNDRNNHLGIYVYTMAMTDVSVSVAQSSVTGTNGTVLQLPRITVANTTSTAREITVDIPLPAFTSVSAINPFSGICTGTTTLQCTLYPVPPNNTREIDIFLNTSATGTFTSSISMRGVNDSTTSNNTSSIAITVNAPASSSSSSSGGGSSSSSSSGGSGSSSGGATSSSGGGKGGGGRFEWLALTLLAALAWRRGGRVTSA
jgi:hypothetical protein